MVELPGHGSPGNARTPATRTPIISHHHTAGNHSTVNIEELPGRFKAKVVMTAEGDQARAMEGSVVHEGLAVERPELENPMLSQGKALTLFWNNSTKFGCPSRGPLYSLKSDEPILTRCDFCWISATVCLPVPNVTFSPLTCRAGIDDGFLGNWSVPGSGDMDEVGSSSRL